MKFYVTGCNYIGTPTGWLETDSIESVTSLISAEFVNESPSDISALYKVDAGDTGTVVALIPGDVSLLECGERINCRQLSDAHFNGSIYPNTFDVVDYPII